MQFPRLVFFIAALTVTAIVMVGFTCYHVYQILSNQTTNERYKKYYLKRAKKEIHPNIYNRGILNNLFEEFFPQMYIDRVLKNRTSMDTQNGVKQSSQSRNKNEVNGLKKRKRWNDAMLQKFAVCGVQFRYKTGFTIDVQSAPLNSTKNTRRFSVEFGGVLNYRLLLE